ncbi:hypothetical protein KM043_018686 [Ampulex compressa]|nr:hypothetical protein KM043_018686 [Ampulex compressa]
MHTIICDMLLLLHVSPYITAYLKCRVTAYTSFTFIDTKFISCRPGHIRVFNASFNSSFQTLRGKREFSVTARPEERKKGLSNEGVGRGQEGGGQWITGTTGRKYLPEPEGEKRGCEVSTRRQAERQRYRACHSVLIVIVVVLLVTSCQSASSPMQA